jgi:hypothetical protein
MDHAANARRGSKTSEAWDLGNEYCAENDTALRLWRCKMCSPQRLFVLHKSNISSANRHLKSVHDIQPATAEGNAQKRKAQEELYEQEMPKKVKTLIQEVNAEQFRSCLLQWIVEEQIPFTTVESSAFQGMLEALNEGVKKYLVKSGSTIRNWAKDAYLKAQQQIIQHLGNSKSRVHISFDLWTSPNSYAILGIMAHYVNQDLRNESALLGFKRVKGSHSGENMAAAMAPVLEEFGVVPKLGVFVADNAQANDLAIVDVLKELRPDIQEPASRRARCMAHIINLAAKDFIFGNDVEAFEEAVKNVDEGAPLDSSPLKKAQEAWRLKGPIGKFHNVCVFIRASPQRREAFMKCCSGVAGVDGKFRPFSELFNLRGLAPKLRKSGHLIG